MKGHTRKRGKSWSYVIEQPRGEDGKRRQRWVGGFQTERVADRALREALTKLERGEYVEPTTETVGDYLQQWFDSLEPSLRPSTAAMYDTYLRGHVKPALGTRQLQRLSTAQVSSFYGKLLAEGNLSNGPTDGSDRPPKGLSPTTVRHIHTLLKRALGDAVRAGKLVRNPIDGVSAPRRRRAEMKTWSASEARAFLDFVADDRLYAVYVLALTTGLRRAELLGLRWRDISLDEGWLRVMQTVVSVKYKVIIGTPKTKAGRRSVALDPATVDVLREHRLRQLKERVALGLGNVTADTLVFSKPDGEPLHPSLFTDAFDRHVRDACLPRIRLHDCRHTYATLALAAGVHPKVVQERLGHSSIAITLDLYSHTVPSLQEEAAAKVAGVIFRTS